jgi:hypothetical protein
MNTGKQKWTMVVMAILVFFMLVLGVSSIAIAVATEEASPHTWNQVEWFSATDVGLEGIKENMVYVHQSSIGCADCFSYLVPGDNLQTGEPGYFHIYGIPFPYSPSSK